MAGQPLTAGYRQGGDIKEGKTYELRNGFKPTRFGKKEREALDPVLIRETRRQGRAGALDEAISNRRVG